MTVSNAKAIFIWGTVVSAVIFLALTYDFHRKVGMQTHEMKLDERVVAGKWVWQKYNCNDCHTILGIGGYYAPDITKVAKYRDKAWLDKFLRDPEGVWQAKRKMPNFHLSNTEVASLIAFMGWVSEIDTNDWPRKPMMAAAAPEVSGSGELRRKASEGERLFVLRGCQGCHTVNGVGGKVGPDLSHIGSSQPDV